MGDTGCYSRPVLPQDHEAPKEQKAGDMVEALLANEAQRKKEIEAKSQQEEALQKKMKELKSLSVEDLKKRLVKKGLEASGKKDEMIEALVVVAVKEEAVNARKSELQSKSLQELKELLSRHRLEMGSKDQMIKTMLAHEAKCAKDLEDFEVKVKETAKEFTAQKQQELESKKNAALKEQCAAKGLAVGGGKEELIERLIDET